MITLVRIVFVVTGVLWIALTSGCHSDNELEPVAIVAKVSQGSSGALTAHVLLSNRLSTAIILLDNAVDLQACEVETLVQGKWMSRGYCNYLKPKADNRKIESGGICDIEVIVPALTPPWRLRLMYIMHIDSSVDPFGNYRQDGRSIWTSEVTPPAQ
jgi:hypothetical protein